MSKFKFMEYAVGQPSNRTKFDLSSNIIKMPFEKKNRYTEYWRSMYVYETENPKEEDAMFGNFYIECDEEDFNTNKEIMLDAANYLHKKYDIPFSYFDFFFTNRSIWLTVPTRTFACYGSKKLNLIHKRMAQEIDNYIKGKGYSKGLDLSIYKWNGLMHSLGSYLMSSKRWVTKFTYFDLESSYTKEDVLNAKYDNCFGLEEINPIKKAVNWFLNAKSSISNSNSNISKKSLCDSCCGGKNCTRPCMMKLEENGLPKDNRNLHIYSYSLHLKELGYKTADALDKIKNTFNDNYVLLKECEKTVQSAIEGTKNFNCNFTSQVLNEEFFDCKNCNKNNQNKKTFIVPRTFINILNKSKANYMLYKYLLQILYTKQIKGTNFKLNIKNEKYKKNIVSNFQKLSELGFISYTLCEDEIECNLIIQDKAIYKSYIIIPNDFISSKLFLNIKSELKLLLEICRCGLLIKDKYLYFNIKIDTLISNLKSTKKTILKMLSFLTKKKIIFNKFVFLTNSTKEIKYKINEIVKRVKDKITKKLTYVEKIENSIEQNITKRISIVVENIKSRLFNRDKVSIESSSYST